MRRWAKSLAVLLACFTALGCENSGSPASPPRAGVTATAQPDNTATNARDNWPNAKTPIDQSEQFTDVKITAEIRKRIMDEPDLSTNAKNVKVITAGEIVTLRGPVESAEERDRIARIARAVAGAERVENHLDVLAP